MPRPRKRGVQQQLEFAELTADQIEKNQFVNEIRVRVMRWRELDRPDVTPVTRRLLEYWTDPDRDNPILFCQLEAAETAIYLAEAAQKSGDAWIRNGLDVRNEEHNAKLNRIALKMATGSGKTVVMAMLIAWQTLNKVASPQDARFAKRFLVVTPGLTIKDRLRVLRPEHDENYYLLRDLVPADLAEYLSQARIVITNFHALQRRETKQGQGIAKTTKELLAGYSNAQSPFLESLSQMVSRVCRDLGGTSEIVVFNDEAHHCYRGRLDHPEADAASGALTAEEKEQARANSKAARVWFTGLRAIAGKLGVKTIYDLSATPSFLSGSGYQEGTLFPWVVSDFALVEAIESGIVKIPRVPVDDNAVRPDVTFLNLWDSVGADLPKKSRKEGTVSPEIMPPVLEGALLALYGSYEKAFRQWEGSQAAKDGEPPPVFIVVCNNTTVSKMVYDYIAGWNKPVGAEGTTTPVPGKLALFSNVREGHWIQRPPTILIDSEQIESGEALSPEFKRVAAIEIGEFTADYLRRFPGRSADDIDDAQILREVMNTVGKRGKLGEPVRCVVSVSMLTEGWDANTVSHILGVRAFGTQLLCEQVVGRGLRRRSYATDDNGLFTPEYADVYGVPFQFIPTVARTRDLTMKPTRRVHAEPDRASAQITFPKLIGYRIELPDEKLWAEFTKDSRMVLTTDNLPTETVLSGLTGLASIHNLDDLRSVRDQAIAFYLADRVMSLLTYDQDPKPWYFPQVLRITKAWLAECLTCLGDTFPGLLLIAMNGEEAARRIFHESITSQKGDRTEILRPMLRPQAETGTTADVDFFTTKEVYVTSEQRCHVNFVALDGPHGNTWEETVARHLEVMPQVAAYVKNDHLGFAIPYAFEGRNRQYLPDFLVRLKPLDDDAETRTLIVEVSGSHKPPGQTKEKAETTRNLWVPAVNNHGGFGRWSYCELKDPARFRPDLETAIATLRAGTGLAAKVTL